MNRIKLLMGATALLYLGPLLAGLAGFGWAQVPVFAAIFLMWLVILRPGQWPGSGADWVRGPAILSLVAKAAVQLLLVTVCFGIGRGLGGVLDFLPPLPFWLPLLISAAAIPLGRLIWNPHKAAEIDAFLDDAIAQIERVGNPPDDVDWSAAMAPILALPPETPDHRALAVLDDAIDRTGGELLHFLRQTLTAAPGAHPAARRAAVLWATEASMVRSYVGYCAPSDAFAVIGDNPALLGQFADRAIRLLDAEPDHWIDCPNAETVEEAAARCTDPAVAAQLRAFIAKMAEVEAPDDVASERETVGQV